MELDGSQLTGGEDGIVIEGTCSSEVRNLVIRDFPHHAIEARQTPEQSAACGSRLPPQAKLLVSKTELVHNERGVVTKGMDARLSENVIHENRRSGVFLDGPWFTQLANNVIVNNGASGVFVNNGEFPGLRIPSSTSLVENVIHGNAEFGVARTRNGVVSMRHNSLVRNGVFAYDVDLDLATPNRNDDSSGVPNKPVLISASYDPATNTTTVRGVVGTMNGYRQLDVYASDQRDARGGPQAERLLTTTYVGYQHQDFEIQLPGDLRGQWITATHSASLSVPYYYLRPAPELGEPTWYGEDTSELSEAIQVQ